MLKKRVFVTVGTTQFQKLITMVLSDEILKILVKQGYNELIIQYGTGEITEISHPTLNISSNSYFENFSEELSKADLVISHAGAGSCLETLKLKKALIVVINEDLMDNHQTELAEELAARNHLYYCTCSTLPDTLEKPLNDLKPYPKPNSALFNHYLNKCMGFTS